MLKFLDGIFKRYGAKEEHQAILGAIDNAVGVLKADVDLARLEMYILTSTGKWLDYWASWFGISRLPDEQDEAYRMRIIAMVSNPKSTIPAIIATVKSYLGRNDLVEVYEPYKNVKIFNESVFSGNDVYQTGDYYRSGVIDVVISAKDIDSSLRTAVDQTKAAGIRVYFTKRDELGLSGEPIVTIVPKHDPYSNKILYIEPFLPYSEDLNLFSKSPGLLSGRQNLWSSRDRTVEIVVEEETKPFPLERESISMRYPGRSSTAFYSGEATGGKEFNGGFSGYPVGEFDKQYPLPWEPEELTFKPDAFVGTSETLRAQTQREVQMAAKIIHKTEQRSVKLEKHTDMFSSIGVMLHASSLVEVGKLYDFTVGDLLTRTIPYRGSVESKTLPV